MSGYRLTATSIGVLLLIVCGSCADDGRKPVYPVEGQVLYQGKPTPHAMVVLHPVVATEDMRERPLAHVDEEGKFRLTTYERDDGAPSGEYEVSIIWLKQVAERVEEQPNLLPGKYADPKTSGLRVEIKPTANVLQPFTLE